MNSQVWTEVPEPELPSPDARGWLRVTRRALPIIVVLILGIAAKTLIRVLEAPLHGPKRPWSPAITVWVCRISLRLIGLRYERQGQQMRHEGALVANHSSWLDIFTLNAGGPLYFVSKAEVAGWPGIGLLARITGTMFIRRERSYAKEQTQELEARLINNHKLLFFPEGTSTDGQGVVAFKTTLFASFFAPALRDEIWVQPISVRYIAPDGQSKRFYGWWGETEFAPHLLVTLAAPKQGRVRVIYHDPLAVSDYPDRKALAAACEAQVRAGHQALAPQ